MEDFWELRGLIAVFTGSLIAYRFPGFFLDVNKLFKILKDHGYIFILCVKAKVNMGSISGSGGGRNLRPHFLSHFQLIGT
jgi:hypothetical protein